MGVGLIPEVASTLVNWDLGVCRDEVLGLLSCCNSICTISPGELWAPAAAVAVLVLFCCGCSG